MLADIIGPRTGKGVAFPLKSEHLHW